MEKKKHASKTSKDHSWFEWTHLLTSLVDHFSSLVMLLERIGTNPVNTSLIESISSIQSLLEQTFYTTQSNDPR
jgi:prephenate dehydratase